MQMQRIHIIELFRWNMLYIICLVLMVWLDGVGEMWIKVQLVWIERTQNTCVGINAFQLKIAINCAIFCSLPLHICSIKSFESRAVNAADVLCGGQWSDKAQCALVVLWNRSKLQHALNHFISAEKLKLNGVWVCLLTVYILNDPCNIWHFFFRERTLWQIVSYYHIKLSMKLDSVEHKHKRNEIPWFKRYFFVSAFEIVLFSVVMIENCLNSKTIEWTMNLHVNVDKQRDICMNRCLYFGEKYEIIYNSVFTQKSYQSHILLYYSLFINVLCKICI